MGKRLASHILHHAVGNLIGKKVHHPLGNCISHNDHSQSSKHLQKSGCIYISRTYDIIYTITTQNGCIQGKSNSDKRCQKHNDNFCFVRADKFQYPLHSLFIPSHQRFTSCSESCDRQISL